MTNTFLPHLTYASGQGTTFLSGTWVKILLKGMIGMIALKHIALFVGGTLFGTAGFKLLKSKEAKKVYVHTAAAALRAKESVMKDVTRTRESCGDILAEAKLINEEKRTAAVEKTCIIEDESGEEQ